MNHVWGPCLPPISFPTFNWCTYVDGLCWCLFMFIPIFNALSFYTQMTNFIYYLQQESQSTCDYQASILKCSCHHLLLAPQALIPAEEWLHMSKPETLPLCHDHSTNVWRMHCSTLLRNSRPPKYSLTLFSHLWNSFLQAPEEWPLYQTWVPQSDYHPFLTVTVAIIQCWIYYPKPDHW